LAALAADLGVIIHQLLKDPSVLPGFRAQFRPQEGGDTAAARNLNAAFLIAFTGKRLSHPAMGYLYSMSGGGHWGSTARFYLEALDRMEEELSGSHVDDLAAHARDLVRHLDASTDMSDVRILEKYWSLFFPEGVGLASHTEGAVQDLRRTRTVKVKKLNPDPITRPHEEVLFSSNVLLTVPLGEFSGRPSLPPELEEALDEAAAEEQAFWYDHPIPIGIKNERNEAVYGLRAMDRAIRFEIERGNAPADSRVPVLLSMSTTHHGLQALAHEYLAGELVKAGGVRHLEIYAAAQRDVRELLDKVIIPAAGHLLPGRDVGPLAEVLGVDGEYGRHYSFLKAVSGFWQVMVDCKIRATYKFDLDQVFPQEELVALTGRSAFEHLCDPLWGGKGTDSLGRDIQFGMLAGALVNEADIGEGLFSPDVKWPIGGPAPDEWVFASTWPQALSTESEMMARYGVDGLDGQTSCLQRVHVTGGTTGIRVEHLRRHRPFTPGWIGRAEDQAYLLSVFLPEEGPALRYFHASGFIMRHDKEAFAGDALKAARVGKIVGDLVRIWNFTSYAKALPWGVEAIKETFDPFTGCFISRLPVTVTCLRMALKAAGMFAGGNEKEIREGADLVRTGSARLGDAMAALGDPEAVRGRYLREKEGWDLYYDVLDALEKALEEGDAFAQSLRDSTGELLEGWKVQHAVT